MSSQRVIQDSDDEDEDVRSEVASSCDPLQDPFYAPGQTTTGRTRDDACQSDFQKPPSAVDLPQVDFDRFLRSESSIMAGDYEDERWAPTADSNLAQVAHTKPNSVEEIRDDSFLYTINAPNPHHPSNAHSVNLENAQYDLVADDIDHPSKRRRLSLSQDPFNKGLEKCIETNSSYNFFASSGPNEIGQTAILPPPLTTNESYGATASSLPVQSPPPTIPFSEDASFEQEFVAVEAHTDHEIQEMNPQHPLPEVDNETLSNKKKRGRAKKDTTTESADAETKADGNFVEHPEQSTKKKPGRPKKQESDTVTDQLPIFDDIQESPNKLVSTSKAARGPKKKMKRSKTTSDLPNKAGEMKAETGVVWVAEPPVESSIELTHETVATKGLPVPRPIEEKSMKSITKQEQAADEKTKAPKKRGRKRKETTGEPTALIETKSVLQDISNISHAAASSSPPPQDKERHIDAECKADIVNKGIGETSASDTLDAPTTPKYSNDSSGPDSNSRINQGIMDPGADVQTPTMPSASHSVKQTPISSTGKVPFRVGLSRRARIAPLLKVVRK